MGSEAPRSRAFVRALAAPNLLFSRVMIGAVSPGRFVVRLAIRAALLVVTFAIALVVWEAVAARQSNLALQSPLLTPAQRAALQRVAAAGQFPAPDVGGALGPSLEPLALALILGTAVGVALAV